MNGDAQIIWLLRAGDEKKYLRLVGFLPDNDYWERNFYGSPMDDQWELPPLEILGKSKKLGDFVGWMLKAPIVSDRARTVLEPVVGSDAQFVRFHELGGRRYYGINVLRIERDLLDLNRSKCMRRKDGGIAHCTQYVFTDLPQELPSIFKISEGSDVLVTSRFVDAVVENKLSGFCLQDPGANALALMAAGAPLNVYPGLP
jgi:hypothetical protein